MGKNFQVGDTVYLACIHETYTLSTNTWAEADPDSGFPLITIIDPDGTTQVDGVAMSKRATGKFDYEYTIPADGEGLWRGYVDVEVGGYPNRQYFTFKVED